MPTLQDKLDDLKARLREIAPCAVAFSAGVDSTLLLAVAHEVLGDGVVAITADSPAHPARELAEAQEFCRQRGIQHVVFEVNELEIEGFDHNPRNRCYLCKNHLFDEICRRAAEMGHPAVLEGSNLDDMDDYRPGFQAIRELGVHSPLLDAQLTKADIRELSAHMGLATAGKQSFACLFSRFAYGDLISPEKLAMIDAAEQALIDLGLGTVRVRMVGGDPQGAGATARIEVAPDDFDRIMGQRTYVVEKLKEYGFSYVALDLQGYRTGAMNETLAP